MLQTEPIYASPGGIPLRYDFFRPNIPEPLPLLVCLHGGGWISGDKGDFREIAEIFVAHGYAAACIQYRLAPLHHFPAAVEDARAFVRFARLNAREFGIDPQGVAAIGTSAGGHLALMLGVEDETVDDVSSRVNAVIDYCGIADLRQYRERHFPISWSFLEQFMGEPYEGNEALFESASPVALVGPSTAPTLIVHGEADDIVPIAQSEELEKALARSHVPHRLLRLPSEGHGFTMASWPLIERATLEFLHQHL